MSLSAVLRACRPILLWGAVLLAAVGCDRPAPVSDRQLVSDGIYRIIRFGQTGHREEYMNAMDKTLAGLGPRAAPTLIEILGHERNTAVSGWAAIYLQKFPGKATDEALLTGIDPGRGFDVVFACCEVLGARIFERNLAVPVEKVERAAVKCLPQCKGRDLRSVVGLLVDCHTQVSKSALIKELARRRTDPVSRLSIAKGLWDIGEQATRDRARTEVALLNKDGFSHQSRALADHIAAAKGRS